MNLRALAKDYANGVLGTRAYREARDELIEGILLGHIKVAVHDFQPPLNVQRVEAEPDITAFRPNPVTKADPKPSAAITEPGTDAAKTPTTHRGILAGITIIIVCLIVLVSLYPFTRQRATVSDATDQTTFSSAVPQSDTQNPVTVSAGENLIKQFLGQNDWTDENLQQFITQWQELSAEEQDAGLSSSARTQLANAIHRKLVEERAILGLGDIQSSVDRQNVLVNFARQIGISDPRLSVKATP